MSNESVITVVPDAFAYGGSAVAALPDGIRCFIPFAIPGEPVRITVVSRRKRFAIGRTESPVTPSPLREVPPCPLFRDGICPGCVYQHVDYATECEWKQKQFERFMVHSGLIEKTETFIPAPERYFWRNKITFSVFRDGDRFLSGYTGFDNKTLFPAEQCLLAEKELGTFIRERLADPEFRNGFPEGYSRAVFRRTTGDGCIFVAPTDKNRFLTDSIPGHGTFKVPSGSFFQINRQAAGLLLTEFQKWINELEPDLFAELYCGSGIFSAAAFRAGVNRVAGIELDPAAVKAAKINLAGAEARFFSGDAADFFQSKIFSSGKRPLLFVDPPRTGLSSETINGIITGKSSRLIYVSCGPDTLARDLGKLTCSGWRVLRTQAFDLFPATMHFESMTLLERG